LFAAREQLLAALGLAQLTCTVRVLPSAKAALRRRKVALSCGDPAPMRAYSKAEPGCLSAWQRGMEVWYNPGYRPSHTQASGQTARYIRVLGWG